MTVYKTYVIIDGKPRWIIVNENGDAINKNPSSKELECVQIRDSQRTRVQYTDEELLNYFEVFHKEHGRAPVAKDFSNNPVYPTYTTYQKRFGSWNNALKLAGLDNREKFGRSSKYNDEELLNFLNIFYEENGKIPARRDFINDIEYPDYQNYTAHFGSWNNALKLVGMDLETSVRQGNLSNSVCTGRLWETIVTKHLGNRSIDLSGKNIGSTFDGICPNGQTYDAKSSRLRIIGQWSGWSFVTDNQDKDDNKEAIEWYYFGAFNKYYTELLYVWRVPGEIVDRNKFIVGMYGGKFTVDNMKKYDITSKFKSYRIIKRGEVI